MLVPKGTEAGAPYQLFVMMSNYELDQVSCYDFLRVNFSAHLISMLPLVALLLVAMSLCGQNELYSTTLWVAAPCSGGRGRKPGRSREVEVKSKGR